MQTVLSILIFLYIFQTVTTGFHKLTNVQIYFSHPHLILGYKDPAINSHFKEKAIRVKLSLDLHIHSTICLLIHSNYCDCGRKVHEVLYAKVFN